MAIVRNTRPRIVGIGWAVTGSDERVETHSILFQPGNNLITQEQAEELKKNQRASKVFGDYLKTGVLAVVSKGSTSPEDVRKNLSGIYSVIVLADLKNDPAYVSIVKDIDQRIAELATPKDQKE